MDALLLSAVRLLMPSSAAAFRVYCTPRGLSLFFCFMGDEADNVSRENPADLLRQFFFALCEKGECAHACRFHFVLNRVCLIEQLRMSVGIGMV